MRLPLLALPLVALLGCGSPCTGEFVAADGACAPGCAGFPVVRVAASCARESQTWCVPQAEVFDTESHRFYWFNTETGEAFVTAGIRDPEFAISSSLRLATGEERAAVDACFAAP